MPSAAYANPTVFGSLEGLNGVVWFLTHVLGDEIGADNRWFAACRIGWAFRALFQLPDVNSMIRSANWGQDFWRSAVRYCAGNCIHRNSASY